MSETGGVPYSESGMDSISRVARRDQANYSLVAHLNLRGHRRWFHKQKKSDLLED